MSNKFYGIFLFLFLFSFCSCQKQQIRDTRGYVSKMNAHALELKTVDGMTLKVDHSKAIYTNGLIMPTDSILMSYISGRGDSVRAVVISLIFNPTTVIYNDSLLQKYLGN